MVSPVASCALPLTVDGAAVEVAAKIVTRHAVDGQMFACSMPAPM